MTAHGIGVLDTSIIAALALYDPAELPETLLITAITLGELSFGPHATDDPLKRAARVAVPQHVESTFEPLPYDRSRSAIVRADLRGGSRCRSSAAQAHFRPDDRRDCPSNALPLYTANPDDFHGSAGFVELVELRGRPNDL